jgi:cobalt/nickel transport system permease protein
MHIPDGYLGPETYGSLWVVMAGVWSWASRQVRKTLSARQVPFLAISAAFSFVIMMFNVPVPGGTTGHAVGGTLVAIVLGPWAAVIAVSIAIMVQALLFGDGGITAIAANCFNMAVIMPLSGYVLYRLFSIRARGFRRIAAAGLAAYFSLALAALCAGMELGLQPRLAHTLDGTPLYCPYPLKVTVPVMVGQHLLVFGWIEALVTMLVVSYLLKADPALFTSPQTS